jgi:hypothetical protein
MSEVGQFTPQRGDVFRLLGKEFRHGETFSVRAADDWRPENRLDDGRLVVPNREFVVVYSHQSEEISAVELAQGVASALSASRPTATFITYWSVEK